MDKSEPRPECIRLFRQIVLDVWNEQSKDTTKRYGALKRRLDDLNARKDRLVEAFLYEKAIDREIYDSQLDKLNQKIALVQAEMLDQNCEQIDVEQVVMFSESILLSAARVWQEFPLDQKQRFQQVLFPQGLQFASDSFGTAETSIVFNYLDLKEQTKASLASPAGFEPALPP